ncbi:DUF6941 family protein [Halomonas sp. S2151]|uniref:DUF6941 family protein n=1 Tax=Halomonas sp. S2151 TaxID=579478 RepID=UPI0012EE331A|nr:hypothetical protein [Halomonas sp. S2151]
MKRSLFNIYSDDIRQEVGDKLTFVGTYTNFLEVSEFPTTLPRLCLAVFCSFDREEPIKRLTIEVFLGEEKIAQTEFIPDELPQVGKNLEGSPGVLQGNLVFSPLHLKEPCVMSLVVTADEYELRGIPLDINLSSQTTE